jgi:phage FluMu protein Com
MNEYRCYNCGKLLYKAEGRIEVECICPRCNCINYSSDEINELGIRGREFQLQSINHLCYNENCKRLLFKSIGYGIIETKCGHCKQISNFDTEKLRQEITI